MARKKIKKTKPSVTELMNIALTAIETDRDGLLADTLITHQGILDEFAAWLRDDLNEKKGCPVFGLMDNEEATVLAALRLWQAVKKGDITLGGSLASLPEQIREFDFIAADGGKVEPLDD